MAETDLYDIAVIGGGINGVGIARDAAGRGYRVLLCERDDLASGTSSASTKLIHGGLRYLEHYAFRLVRESLIEREVLLRAAPHIIWPLRFILPHGPGLRPAWMIRMGLFLYDHLGGRRALPGCETIDLRRHPAGQPLTTAFKTGFAYPDCWVQDSRLVVLNAMDARDRGAEVLTRTAFEAARVADERWEIGLTDGRDGAQRTVAARSIVNAAGPWVAETLSHTTHHPRATVRLVKGSHIVVPRLYDGPQAYIFQNPDGRIVFAIPFERDFTLVGTTDVDVPTAEAGAHITPEETAYLCEAIGPFLSTPVRQSDVVWSYAGVRSLFDDGSSSASKLTRDYKLDLTQEAAGPPLLSVYGGKVTTYRRLAETAMARLAPALGVRGDPWTASAVLPGGDIPGGDFDAFLDDFRARHPWLPESLAPRLARDYGTRAARILGTAAGLEDLGEDLGSGLHEAEVDYLHQNEWAETADDILWRRGKLGLRFSAEDRERLESYLG